MTGYFHNRTIFSRITVEGSAHHGPFSHWFLFNHNNFSMDYAHMNALYEGLSRSSWTN